MVKDKSMYKILGLLLTILLAAPITAAHDHTDHAIIEVEKAWARKTRRTVSAAVYFTLHNNSQQMDSLTGVTTSAASNATLHRSYEEDGMMRMDHVDGVPIAPGEPFSFSPGGYHVMLMGLATPLKQGTIFPITLSFEKAGEIEVSVQVTGMEGLK